MPATTDMTITNSANSKQFLFRAVTNVRNRKQQPAQAIPLVNSSPTGNLLFRFTGQSEEIAFDFAIFNDGVDVSNGTEPTITTVAEQTNYLKNTVYGSDFDTSWTIVDANNVFFTSAVSGVITDVEIDKNSGNSTSVVTGTLTFKLGTIANL